MSDETSGATATEAPPEDAPGSAAGSDAAERPEHAVVPAGEQGTFERYVVPFLLPTLVVGAILFYVLNVSRVFIALHGARATVVAVAITLAILAGASALAAAPRMRSSSLRLVVVGSLFVIMIFGTLTIGEAEESVEESALLPPEGPALTELETESGNLYFAPNQLEAETGVVAVTMVNDAGTHTFVIEDPTIEFEKLSVGAPGDVDRGRFFVGEPGDYVFFCDVPGHRAAGMEGVLGVTGDSKTLEEALGELGDGEGGEEPE